MHSTPHPQLPPAIVDYGITYADTIDQLAGIVSMQIKKGWQPFLGIQYINDKYLQCMVSYAPIQSHIKTKKKNETQIIQPRKRTRNTRESADQS